MSFESISKYSKLFLHKDQSLIDKKGLSAAASPKTIKMATNYCDGIQYLFLNIEDNKLEMQQVRLKWIFVF